MPWRPSTSTKDARERGPSAQNSQCITPGPVRDLLLGRPRRSRSPACRRRAAATGSAPMVKKFQLLRAAGRVSRCVPAPAGLWSAFKSEDLPTLERPAKAISAGPSGGSASALAPAQMKVHSPAKSLRPTLGEIVRVAFVRQGHAHSAGRLALLVGPAVGDLRGFRLGRLAPEHALQIIEQLQLHAGSLHDQRLLD